MSTPYHTPSGAASKALVEKGQTYFIPNYKPREMILDYGKGSRIWDLDGNEYMDLAAGIAVSALGHQDPDLLAAFEAQGRKLWHTSNVFFTAPAIELAEALVEAVPFCERVYFANSGTEANEAAIKLIRKWASEQGRPPEKREIITFTGSFHGRTLAAVTATAQPKFHAGFEPLPGGFVYCDPYDDLTALEKMITDKTCAILLETIQGEGGVKPCNPGYLKGVRELCDRHGILMAIDEIQTGMGRTGKLFACMHESVAPDILTSAKALGCGMPIGALLAGKKVAEILQFGSHGSTFGGNPVACAVALAGLKKINTPQMMRHVAAMSERLFAGLGAINAELGMFTEIRGQGLMAGAVLAEQWKGKAGDLSNLARCYGVLVLIAGPDVLRFLPALNITANELDEGLARLKQGLAAAKPA